MSIWNKILIGLILVASLPLLYLSARTLRTHQVWREAAAKLEQEIARVEAEVDLLEYGDPEAGTPSVHEVELALHNRVLARGRMWYDVVPQRLAPVKDPATGAQTLAVTVNPSQQGPHHIAPKMILYVFEGKPFEQGGRYLGQFVVTNVAANAVQMVPATWLTPREVKRLRASAKPWVLYEQLPRDEEAVLAELSDEQIKALFPGASQQEYLQRKGRKLRDYYVLFSESRRRLALLTHQINAARDDNKYLKDAQASALAQEQTNEKDIRAARAELNKVTEERNLVAKHLAALQEAIAGYQQRSGELVQSIRSLANQLAKVQLEAIQRIDARTRGMAQAGSP